MNDTGKNELNLKENSSEAAKLDSAHCRDECVTDYRSFLNNLTESERNNLPSVKRFFECVTGDKTFAQMLDDNDWKSAHSYLKEIGVEFSQDEIAILHKDLQIMTSCEERLTYTELLRKTLERNELNELTSVYFKWQSYFMNESGTLYYPPVKSSTPMASWQKRRIASAKSELGYFGNQIDHPLFAFELAKGCSVNCWFCAFSAEKLQAVWKASDENLNMWRSIQKINSDLFSPQAAGFALCYYATEPMDNADYLTFIEEVEETTGSVVCTSTAAPERHPDRFRKLLEYYRSKLIPWPRLSILSTEHLRKIHLTYNPEELRDARLLMQLPESTGKKFSPSGNILHDAEKSGNVQVEEETMKQPEAELGIQGSISCVSGFYVNLIDSSVKIISPCFATEKWPYGYRVFGEAEFDSNSSESYLKAIESLISNCIFDKWPEDKPVKWREDIRTELVEDGFCLHTPCQRHTMKGKSWYKSLGEAIEKGTYTRENLISLMVENGANYLQASKTFEQIFNRGLLNELFEDS